MTQQDELLLTVDEMNNIVCFPVSSDHELCEAQLAKARPIIEKQERERQLNWFIELIEDYGNVFIRKYEIRRIVRQALKGE